MVRPINNVEISWLPSYRAIVNEQPLSSISSNGNLEDIKIIDSKTSFHLPNDSDESLVRRDFFIGFFIRHLNRFCNGNFGVIYVANEYSTAVDEALQHRADFFRRNPECQGVYTLRLLKADLLVSLRDIRHLNNDRNFRRIYSSTDHFDSREYANYLQRIGSSGIVYTSIRGDGEGECAAIFRTDVFSNFAEMEQVRYRWDGFNITPL